MSLPISALSPRSRRPEAITCTASRLAPSSRATVSKSRRYSITGWRARGLRFSTGLTFEVTRVGIVCQNSVGCSVIACTPVRSGGRVSTYVAPTSFTQVGPEGVRLKPHMKTARLSPRRRSSQRCEGLAARATRGLAILLDHEVRLVGVALLSRVMTAHGTDRSSGDIVVVAAFKATRRRHGSDASGSGVALGQSGRSNRANAQDDSSNSRSNTSVHGTIHLGLRGLRRKAAGRDLFSDLDLGPIQLERRAVSHPLSKPRFFAQEHGTMIRPRTTVPISAAP